MDLSIAVLSIAAGMIPAMVIRMKWREDYHFNFGRKNNFLVSVPLAALLIFVITIIIKSCGVYFGWQIPILISVVISIAVLVVVRCYQRAKISSFDARAFRIINDTPSFIHYFGRNK